MKTRTLATAVGAAIVLAALGLSPSPASRGNASAAQARAVAREFFQTIDRRSFARTCDLLSARFYRQNHVPDKRRCILGLTVGMAMAPGYRFEITRVRLTGDEAVVAARANGVPGRVVLVRERGRFKVLSVQGG